jgi:nickel-dependent lactate racemase
MAGFSGGAKIILPGASGIETIEYNHSNLSGRHCEVDNNVYRADMEEAAGLAGLSFIVNAVINAKRDICGIFAGDFIRAHREACDFARKVYDTPSPAQADMLLINSYPMDTELFQAAKSLELIRHYQDIKDIVLIADCADGFGYHALCGYGGRMQVREKEGVAKLLLGRHLVIVSKNIEHHDVIKKFPDETTVCGSLESAIDKLRISEKSGGINVILFPTAPLQIVNIYGG